MALGEPDLTQITLQDLRSRIARDPSYRPTANEMRLILMDLQQGRAAAAATARRAAGTRQRIVKTIDQQLDLDNLFTQSNQGE